MENGPLPEYSSPPVAEVVLALAFEELVGFSAGHLGLLWDRFRTSYPRVEDHPPLDLHVEIDPGGDQMQKPPSIEFLTKLRVRCWFLNPDGTQLIQAQSDMFAHNWRKQGTEGASYPRYANVRESFLREVIVFNHFLSDLGLGKIVPRVCELTYVNHLRSRGGVSPHASLAEFITLFRQPEKRYFLPPAEDGRLSVRFPILDNTGFLGRLNVSLQPAYVIQPKEPILNLALVARGKPREKTIDGAMAFFDLAHEWIVRGFTEITTPEMQAVWGRSR